MTHESDEIFNFPCDFPIKAMGKTDDDLLAQVLNLIQKHVESIDESRITTKASKNGKFTAITVTITATSRAQLDAIYQDLTDCCDVLYAI